MPLGCKIKDDDFGIPGLAQHECRFVGHKCRISAMKRFTVDPDFPFDHMHVGLAIRI